MPGWRRRADEDFSDEVRAHLDLEAERLIADGMAPAAARAAARKAFGNVAAAQERFHESSRWVWLEQFGQERPIIRVALRRWKGHHQHFDDSALKLTLDDAREFVAALGYLIETAEITGGQHAKAHVSGAPE